MQTERWCYVCGVVVGHLVFEDDELKFVPTEACAPCFTTRYTCKDHA